MDARSFTFLFTDIEGSTKLWETYPEQMTVALSRHDDILRAVIKQNSGRVFKTIGDAFCAAFTQPPDGLDAALAIQAQLAAEEWPLPEPIRVRVALHSGPAEERDGDYFGPTLNRVARLLAIVHGGQVLVSETVAPELNVPLEDMGMHRLKDLSQPARVFQVLHPDLPSDLPPLRSLSYLPNNLPQQLSTFVGREAELSEVKKELSEHRLLTLIGSGGCGKTRLALQAAADLLSEYPVGVWLVELAAISDPHLVGPMLVTAMGLRVPAGASPVDVVAEQIGNNAVLVLMDNCEHLIDACAQLANALLSRCPAARVMATSREPLRVGGEQTWRVPSLSVPTATAGITATQLMDSESGKLFRDRAALSQPQFEITDTNALPIAQICERLDGIPLAIELAAARCKVLSPEQIAMRLDDQFRLLAGGSRTDLPRHQTLRATIDWSYQLLNEEERAVFRRLSVFRRGWPLEAAESVCESDDVDAFAVMDTMSLLVDKSLALASDERFSMLGSIRSYGLETLMEAGEAAETGRKHRDWYASFVSRIGPDLDGPNVGARLRELEIEQDNIRAAMEYCLTEDDGGQALLAIIEVISRFWFIRGSFEEGLRWVERALEKAPAAPASLRGHAEYVAAVCRTEMGDYPVAKERYEESLRLRREAEDLPGLATTLNGYGILTSQQGGYQEAMALYEESLEINRQLGRRQAEIRVLNNLGILSKRLGNAARAKELYAEALAASRTLGSRAEEAMFLNNLGNIEMADGQFDHAAKLFEEALLVSREVGNRPGEALNLGNLGDLYREAGDLDRAHTAHADSLRIRKELGDRLGIAFNLEGLASISARRGDSERAVRLFSVADRLRTDIGSPLAPSEREGIDGTMDDLRSSLGEASFKALWTEGHELGMEDAIEDASL